ncbi:hypothetical protein [Trichocoleus sp. FACHB-262]|uniref:hypothetical protein n=1 Tax=Trichocoleus sp. FACHB-262 TaxID=2692869 RepID=UPI0016854245|nr:hypothetical protein [Trichocoleus sp. FACHB-262]MBD2121310.1 hypothetical protein [Trichocoleus sp. FACHB-262]
MAETVIYLTIRLKHYNDEQRVLKALDRFTQEDQTLRVRAHRDPDAILIAGMSEQHLEIYIERLKREYNTELNFGSPAVDYRATIYQGATFDYQMKKGNQYGRVMGRIEPCGKPFVFENQVANSTIPAQLIAACEVGFLKAAETGFLVGYPVTGVRVLLEGVLHDPANSSKMLFQILAQQAFQEALWQAKPIVLEPIMLVEVKTPNQFLDQAYDDLMSRHAFVRDLQIMEECSVIRAEVQLKEMLGYSKDLSSLTSDQASFLMEFNHHYQVSYNEQTQIILSAVADR